MVATVKVWREMREESTLNGNIIYLKLQISPMYKVKG